MSRNIEELFKPVSALNPEELNQLEAMIAEYKRIGAIHEQGPFDTRVFIDVNDETVRKVRDALRKA